MGMRDHFALLGLWDSVSQVPRALPWAFTLCAFGTERFARSFGGLAGPCKACGLHTMSPPVCFFTTTVGVEQSWNHISTRIGGSGLPAGVSRCQA